MKAVLTLAACAALLAGCGEIDQSKTAEHTNRNDVAAFQGAKNEFMAKNWTPGNHGSWDNQIRARGQYQNEYMKTK